MNIEATNEYQATENGVYIGSFLKDTDGYVYTTAAVTYEMSELQDIVNKLIELNSNE